jgi:hypothetical protein
MVDMWTAEDEEELVKISNKEIDMLETYLGRYAALQKRNAVAAVLDFTNEEWGVLKGPQGGQWSGKEPGRHGK